MAPRRTLVALVSSVAIVAAGALASPAAAHGRGTPQERFVQQVSTKNVVRHLTELQKIADRNDGNRAALTPGYEASARYVEKTLRKAGYRTERDPFTFDREVIDAATLTSRARPRTRSTRWSSPPTRPRVGSPPTSPRPRTRSAARPTPGRAWTSSARSRSSAAAPARSAIKADTAEAAGAIGVVDLQQRPRRAAVRHPRHRGPGRHPRRRPRARPTGRRSRRGRRRHRT